MSLVLIVLTFSFIVISFICIMMDVFKLLTNKSSASEGKETSKLAKYSYMFGILCLIFMIFLSIGYI